MPTHAQLIKRAKRMGYEVTPTLSAELRMLADVSDEDLQQAHYRTSVRQIAAEFKVPVPMAIKRLGNSIPPLKLRSEG